MKQLLILLSIIFSTNSFSVDGVTSATKLEYREAKRELIEIAREVCFSNLTTCTPTNDSLNMIIKATELIKVQKTDRLKKKHLKTFFKNIEIKRITLAESYDFKSVSKEVDSLISQVKRIIKSN